MIHLKSWRTLESKWECRNGKLGTNSVLHSILRKGFDIYTPPTRVKYDEPGQHWHQVCSSPVHPEGQRVGCVTVWVLAKRNRISRVLSYKQLYLRDLCESSPSHNTTSTQTTILRAFIWIGALYIFFFILTWTYHSLFSLHAIIICLFSFYFPFGNISSFKRGYICSNDHILITRLAPHWERKEARCTD